MTRCFSFSPLRDSCSPLRGFLAALSCGEKSRKTSGTRVAANIQSAFYKHNVCFYCILSRVFFLLSIANIQAKSCFVIFQVLLFLRSAFFFQFLCSEYSLRNNSALFNLDVLLFTRLREKPMRVSGRVKSNSVVPPTVPNDPSIIRDFNELRVEMVRGDGPLTM